MTRFRDPQTRRKGSVYYTSLSEAPYWQVALVSYDREVFEPIVRMWRLSRLLILCGLLILFFIINRYVRSARRLQQARIEQARIGSELGIARSIQMEMLPKPLAKRPDLDIHGFLVPAREVGGDLYDFFLQDGKLFFCIGDVSGKGVPSAMVMSKIQSLFRRISAHVSDPARIVQVLNE
jgi:serine phosphatase RsbU (regulator of sigma subunit)